MKKKLAMLLALVLAFGGTSAALLTSCKPTCTPDQNEQESEYKVRFLKEDGTLIEEKTVKHGEKVEAVTAPAKEGYTAEWVDKDGNVADLEKAVTADAEYKVRYTAKTDVAYKVEYYFENVEGAYDGRDRNCTRSDQRALHAQRRSRGLSCERRSKGRRKPCA